MKKQNKAQLFFICLICLITGFIISYVYYYPKMNKEKINTVTKYEYKTNTVYRNICNKPSTGSLKQQINSNITKYNKHNNPKISSIHVRSNGSFSYHYYDLTY